MPPQTPSNLSSLQLQLSVYLSMPFATDPERSTVIQQVQRASNIVDNIVRVLEQPPRRGEWEDWGLNDGEIRNIRNWVDQSADALRDASSTCQTWERGSSNPNPNPNPGPDPTRAAAEKRLSDAEAAFTKANNDLLRAQKDYKYLEGKGASANRQLLQAKKDAFEAAQKVWNKASDERRDAEEAWNKLPKSNNNSNNQGGGTTAADKQAISSLQQAIDAAREAVRDLKSSGSFYSVSSGWARIRNALNQQNALTSALDSANLSGLDQSMQSARDQNNW
ncbi:hypothetical protein BKA62DRAFT_726173 [Auriculariales sp. MPI-PUGE-AT-0066]|nr:hypothetical protein BKA62DRAFT_726173 [Auriculariales sp. MPI-PUGE-AT-0066]